MGIAKCFEELSVAYSKTGKNNMERDAECEDVIFIDETPEIKFWGIADGQTRKKYCREGGKKVLEAVFHFISDKGITQMTRYEHVDELQYELIRVVRETISKMALNEKVEKTEYASTLVVLACDTHTGNYTIIHLGDGSIIGRKKDGSISMLSSPENGLTTSYTWLTTSKEALLHLRIGFGCIQDYKRIVMITDGATVLARGKNISEKTQNMIVRGSRDDIVTSLAESNPTDDASCIIIDFA
mgnify:FL=1